MRLLNPGISKTPYPYGSTELYSNKQINPTLKIGFGPNNFGDLMGTCTNTTVNGNFFPMERVVLTANGNLQRIMSAYYGATVEVKVLRCDKLQKEDKENQFSKEEYDREVDIFVAGKKFCNAKGKIELLDDSCVEAIESKAVGVGQLFRFLGVLPTFQLTSAGHNDDGQLWRRYTLSAPQLSCTFLETFEANFLEFTPSI
jgi:hypothetical protein